MTKKGGVQQLQTEINTTEELAKFLDRDGLIVLDVYTEWCGPCLAMIGSLKKIKLEQGGDDLHLAIVKCDRIDAFERFRNKCEPTWLLASKGKLVNCAFGANVPHLIELILKELDIERRTRDTDSQTSGRDYFELAEMTPVERQQFDALQQIEEETDRIEEESAQRRRIEYLTFVTDEIMKNSNDMGVTVLMPHVISRDLLKRLSDPADKCRLVAKDKKNALVLSDHIDVLRLCTSDMMPQCLIDHIVNHDVFVVCWKVTDNNADGDKNVEEYLGNLKRLVWSDDETPNGNPSILKALSIVIETDVEVNDEENMIDENENAEELPVDPKSEAETENEGEPKDNVQNESNPVCGEDAVANDQVDSEATAAEEANEGNEVAVDANSVDATENEINSDRKSSVDNDEAKAKVEETKSSERSTPTTSVKRKGQVEMKIQPIWTPTEKRANAALIYLYFRSLTELYLPPDPPVKRPHLAIIFDAYKHREIMEVIDAYRDEVLAYGYFTTDSCETAQLIANSTFNYHKSPPTIYDKFILKVAKANGSVILPALKKLGPSYISKNTEIGKVECSTFFPAGYKNSSETGETTPVPVDDKPKKKKKKRKTKQGSDEENDNAQLQSVTQAPADIEAAEEPEDGTEQDDDDSAEDDDSSADVRIIE